MAFAIELNSHNFSKPEFRVSADDDECSASESNIPSFSSVHSRLSAPVPSLQSTVKVEGRKENAIDRFKVCPLLLRVFYTYERHHSPIDYKNQVYPKNELQIHTWMDATLSEIIIHLQRKNRKLRRSGTVIKFQIVSADPARPRYRTRDIGSVKIDTKGPDDLKTLVLCRFTIGDFLDLCVKLPKN